MPERPVDHEALAEEARKWDSGELTPKDWKPVPSAATIREMAEIYQRDTTYSSIGCHPDHPVWVGLASIERDYLTQVLISFLKRNEFEHLSMGLLRTVWKEEGYQVPEEDRGKVRIMQQGWISWYWHKNNKS